MTNLVKTPSLPFGLDPFNSFFGPSLFTRMASELESGGKLMEHRREDDGTTHLSYNLAGYRPEEIELKFDTGTAELSLRAVAQEGGKSFATLIALPPHAQAEDISTSYEHGVLRIAIAPLEKRREAAVVSIPLGLEAPKRAEEDAS